MGVWIEGDIDRGPSRLDEKMESLPRDSEGNIWLHPQKARDLLFPGLLAFYQAQMAQRSEALKEVGGQGLPLNVEALAQIANLDGETRLVNLTRLIEQLADQRAEVRAEEIASAKTQLSQTRREPPQREF